MNKNFQRALELVLKHEGGYVNHPSDPGGHTNKGVTLDNYRRYVKPGGTVADLKAISDEEVATVYRRFYWDAVKGDDLPAGIDYAVFDFAVNSGPSRAAKYLQRVLGVAQDGIIGPQTLAAARAAKPSVVIDNLCDRRMIFLKGLSIWPTFGKGWTRRVEDVRTESKRMAAASHYAPTPTPRPETPDEAAGKAGGVGGLIGIIIAAIAAGAAIIFGMGD